MGRALTILRCWGLKVLQRFVGWANAEPTSWPSWVSCEWWSFSASWAGPMPSWVSILGPTTTLGFNFRKPSWVRTEIFLAGASPFSPFRLRLGRSRTKPSCSRSLSKSNPSRHPLSSSHANPPGRYQAGARGRRETSSPATRDAVASTLRALLSPVTPLPTAASRAEVSPPHGPP